MNWRRELVEQMKREQLDAAEMPLELPPPVGIIRVKQNVSGDGFLGNPGGAGGNGCHVWGASILLAQWLSGTPALSPYRSPALDLALPPARYLFRTAGGEAGRRAGAPPDAPDGAPAFFFTDL